MAEKWKLTDPDIKRTMEKALGINPLGMRTANVGASERAVAIEAQKKLARWLHEPCYKHDTSMLRLGCPECWEDLRKGLDYEH